MTEARREAEAIEAEARRETAAKRAEAERERREESVVALAAAWLNLCSAETRALCSREAQVVQAAQLIGELLLGREPPLEPTNVAAIACEAMSAAVRRVRILANPADAEPLRARLGALGLGDATVELGQASDFPRGRLRVSTDLGHPFAELTCDLDQMIALLRPC